MNLYIWQVKTGIDGKILGETQPFALDDMNNKEISDERHKITHQAIKDGRINVENGMPTLNFTIVKVDD